MNETERVINFARTFLGIEVCNGMCGADSERTHASLNQASFLVELAMKFARKLLVQTTSDGGSEFLVNCLSCRFSLHHEEAHRIETENRGYGVIIF